MLGPDHVPIAIFREAGVQAVAGLGRFPVAEVVGQDDEVARGVERLAFAKQFGGEDVARGTLANEAAAFAAGAVQDEHGVLHDALVVAARLAHGAIMDANLGQGVARSEAKIANDIIAFDWFGEVGGNRRHRQQQPNRNRRRSHAFPPEWQSMDDGNDCRQLIGEVQFSARKKSPNLIATLIGCRVTSAFPFRRLATGDLEMKAKLAFLVWAALCPVVIAAEPLPVKTGEFKSEAVGRTMKYHIVLPAKYEQSNERYPVLYLLHGYTGNYLNWARMGVPEYARAYDLIVVMPDAGNSWYVNWAKSEGGQKNNWEDCLMKDLIGHVDSTYRTIASREGRAINGLSMGGYGALMLGLRHPDMFCSIGSHSGAVAFVKSIAERLKDGKELPRPNRQLSTQPNPQIGIEGFNSQAERSPKGRMFTTADEAAAYDPFQLVVKIPKDKLPHICVDCGTEDRLLDSNQAFAKLLMEHKITFAYAESPGGHNGAYWTREVKHSMAIQYGVMKRRLAEARKGREASKEGSKMP